MKPNVNADPAELAKFSALAHRWWDPTSEFKPLHDINPLRLEFIAQRCGGFEGKEALDVGCGGGILAEAMARARARVTGIDLSEGMLADGRGIAAERARVGAASYPPNFKIGDAMNPPLEPASVDVVANRNVIWTLLDPQAAFGNWIKLLRPGGRVLAVHHWRMRAGSTYSDALRSALLEKSALGPGLTRNDPQFTEVLVDWLAEAGFADVRTTDLVEVDGFEAEQGSDHLGWLALTAVKQLR